MINPSSCILVNMSYEILDKSVDFIYIKESKTLIRTSINRKRTERR